MSEEHTHRITAYIGYREPLFETMSKMVENKGEVVFKVSLVICWL